MAAERWGLPLELVELPWNADHYLETGETLPAGALEAFRDEYSAVYIGAYGDPRVPDMKHAADILLGTRFGLDAQLSNLHLTGWGLPQEFRSVVADQGRSTIQSR